MRGLRTLYIDDSTHDYTAVAGPLEGMHRHKHRLDGGVLHHGKRRCAIMQMVKKIGYGNRYVSIESLS